MTHTLCRLLRCGAVALALPCALSAQDNTYRPPSLEVDGFVGYTLVDADRWSGFSEISSASHVGFGAAARYMFIRFSGARLGMEVGTQQLFTYTIEGNTGSQIVRRTSTVAGFHVIPVLRMAEGNRSSVDVGFGFHFLGNGAVPGLLVSTNHVILRRARFTIPIGARVNVVLNDPVSAMSLAFKAGVAVPMGK